MIQNLKNYPVVRNITKTKEDLIQFEELIVSHWENAKIRGPVHLSNGNEDQLIEIFKRIRTTDWVFSTWRSHYHAFLKDIDELLPDSMNRKAKWRDLKVKFHENVKKTKNYYILDGKYIYD